MLQSIDECGNINGYRIEYKVEVATDGGAYQQVLSEAVDGKTTSTYERTRLTNSARAKATGSCCMGFGRSTHGVGGQRRATCNRGCRPTTWPRAR